MALKGVLGKKEKVLVVRVTNEGEDRTVHVHHGTRTTVENSDRYTIAQRGREAQPGHSKLLDLVHRVAHELNTD